MIVGKRLFVLPILALLLVSACGPEASISNSGPKTETVRVPSADAVDINTASVEELQRIPHVGESMAEKIVEHREKFGPFRRPEELMLITRISDARFRRIRHLIRVE